MPKKRKKGIQCTGSRTTDSAHFPSAVATKRDRRADPRDRHCRFRLQRPPSGAAASPTRVVAVGRPPVAAAARGPVADARRALAGRAASRRLQRARAPVRGARLTGQP